MDHILRVSLILALGAIFMGFGFYIWLRSYLHSDDFRLFISKAMSDVISADVQFEPLNWQGMRVRTVAFNAQGSGIVRRLDAREVEANMSFSELLHGAWLIRDLRVAELQGTIDLRDKQDALSVSPPVDKSEDQGRGFWASLLPDRAELQALQISSLGVDLQSESGSFEVIDATMTAERRAGKNVYDMSFSNGLINTPWFEAPWKLDTARARYADKRIYLQEFHSQVYQRGMLSLSGELEEEKFELFGTLRDVGVEELIPEDWQKRITGELAYGI